MDHQQATQLAAVDRYLLDEMTSEVRDEFEEHYFDCQECATDLRATATFMDAARSELRPRPLALKAEAKPSRFTLRWRPAIQSFALAASLLVIAYQNLAVLPGFRTEIAQLEAPAVVPSISLVGASRGDSTTSLEVGAAKRFVMQVEIPTDDRFSSYDCLLYSPSGALLWKQEISSRTAKDTVTINAPIGKRENGSYNLVVQGKTSGTDAGVEVQHYPFVLSSQ
jgi:hypothetical protein